MTATVCRFVGCLPFAGHQMSRVLQQTGYVLGNLSCRSIVSTLRMCRWCTMNFMQMSVNAPDSATL